MAKPNGVMMQYFHWYTGDDGSLWNELAENAKDLAKVGITAVWLPPAYKGTGGGYDVGYGVGCGSSEVKFYHETAVIPTDSDQNKRTEAGNYSQ